MTRFLYYIITMTFMFNTGDYKTLWYFKRRIIILIFKYLQTHPLHNVCLCKNRFEIFESA